MAIDSEVKRWSMLRLGGGAVPGIVFNPTGSDADSVTERTTILGLYGGIAWSSSATAHEVALSLALELDQSETNNAILGAGITFAQQLSDTQGNNATLGASALFANQIALSLAGGRSIADAVTLALTTGTSLTSDISIEGSLLLNLQANIAQQNDAVLNAALALDTQLAIAAISQGVLNAGLSLACIQSVSIDGSLLVAGIVTPGGRTLTVTVDTRTITVNPD